MKQDLLLKIQQAGFAVSDMNLYLDTHPDNTDIRKKMEAKQMELQRLKEEYEQLYGKLTHSDKPGGKFYWLSDPWPWDYDREEDKE